LGHQNNYVERLSIDDNVDNNVAKSFDILATNLSVLYNYLGPNKIIFKSVSS